VSLNVRLLRRVRTQILKEPKQFIMATYFTSKPESYSSEIPREVPNCGTTACIGGWALSLAKDRQPSTFGEGIFGTADAAAEVLGLGDTAGDLFCTSNWPHQYRNRWFDTEDLDARARIAAERIDAFIKQHQRKKVKHG